MAIRYVYCPHKPHIQAIVSPSIIVTDIQLVSVLKCR